MAVDDGQTCRAQEKQREEGGGTSIVTMIFACLAEVLFQFVEFLTKFATVRCAITGEAFFKVPPFAASGLKCLELHWELQWALFGHPAHEGFPCHVSCRRGAFTFLPT